MKLISFGARLVNRLVPTVDAHAAGYCYLTGSFCYCSNHKRYNRMCYICDTGSLSCSSCIATTLAC